MIALLKTCRWPSLKERYLPILVCYSGKENLSSFRILLRHLHPQGHVRSCSDTQMRKTIAKIDEDADDSESSDLFTFVLTLEVTLIDIRG